MVGTAITWRSVILGLTLAAGSAWLTPVNDWLLRNTPLYNNYNPCIVTALALLLSAGLNPLLGRFRLRPAEIAVSLCLVLAVGGVVSGGLLRRHTAVMAGAARNVAIDPALATLARHDGDQAEWPFPSQLFLGFDADGHMDPHHPAHENSIDRYFIGGGRSKPQIEHAARVRWRDATGEHEAVAWLPNTLTAAPARILDLSSDPSWRGLRAGDRHADAEILAVSAPELPWSTWWIRLAAWAPLIMGGLAALLGLAGIVRKQWIEHERLSYPIAQVHAALIGADAPQGGGILHSRIFWWSFAITSALLAWKGLADIGLLPIGVKTRIELWRQFSGEPWTNAYNWWFCFNLNIWFSVIALTFLIPKDLSFSMWAGWWGLNGLYLITHAVGIPLERQYAGDASVGGFGAFAVLILWVGRRWYWAAIRAAFRRSDDPACADAGRHVRLLLFGTASMFAFLVYFGAPVLASIVGILLFLGLFLVLARIFAEAGLPFFSVPGNFNRILFACCGTAAPPAAIIMMASIGYTLLADSREGLMPYATNAQYLGHRTGIRSWPLTRWMGVALVVALIVGAATMIWIADTFGGHADTYWKNGFVNNLLSPLADSIANGEQGFAESGSPIASGLAGALIVGAVGWLRLQFAAFPLHPIGLLVCTTYATSVLAFSYFLGWMCKTAVLRYGGVALYRRLIPCAIGVVAGEAVLSVVFALIVALAKQAGLVIGAEPIFMPR